LNFRSPDNGLHGGSVSQLALDGAEDARRLAGDEAPLMPWLTVRTISPRHGGFRAPFSGDYVGFDAIL
jgi:hypothetical protein